MENFSISVTNNAKAYFNNIRNNKSIKIGIKKSGCSGYSYVLDLVDSESSNLLFNEIPFSIINDDFFALNGCEIDYKKDGFSSKIVFNNPNVVNECGCGESFNIK